MDLSIRTSLPVTMQQPMHMHVAHQGQQGVGSWWSNGHQRGSQNGLQNVLQTYVQTMQRALAPLERAMVDANGAANAAAGVQVGPRPEMEQMTADQRRQVDNRIASISGRWERGANDVGGWNDRERTAIETTRRNATEASKYMTFDEAMAMLNEAESRGWGNNTRTFENGAWTNANDYLAAQLNTKRGEFDGRVRTWEANNQAQAQNVTQANQRAMQATSSYAETVQQLIRSFSEMLPQLLSGGSSGGAQRGGPYGRPNDSIFGVDFGAQRRRDSHWHGHRHGSRGIDIDIDLDFGGRSPWRAGIDVDVNFDSRRPRYAMG